MPFIQSYTHCFLCAVCILLIKSYVHFPWMFRINSDFIVGFDCLFLLYIFYCLAAISSHVLIVLECPWLMNSAGERKSNKRCFVWLFVKHFEAAQNAKHEKRQHHHCISIRFMLGYLALWNASHCVCICVSVLRTIRFLNRENRSRGFTVAHTWCAKDSARFSRITISNGAPVIPDRKCFVCGKKKQT